MGIADIIPGISGGTIALMLGIYESFIKAIKSFDWMFFKYVFTLQLEKALAHAHWKFLLNLVVGIITAIICLSKILKWLLANEPQFLFAFFFGLIIATIPLIAKLIKQWDTKLSLTAVLFAMGAWWIVIQKPVFSGDSLLMIFISGFIAISAMILPGISGSFILLLLGQYRNIIEAIDQKDFVVLLVFVSGIFCGVLSIVRVLSWLFKKYHDLTIAAILGIIAGSLPKIWPWKDTISFMEGRHGKIIPLEQVNIIPHLDAHLCFAILLFLSGVVIAFLLNKMPERIDVT